MKQEIMNRAKRFLAIIAVLLIVVCAGCITSPPSPAPAPAPHPNATEIAPAEILGMDKMVVSTGADALQQVRQSHSGNIENIEDLAIVHYYGKNDRFLTLWTTLYQNKTIAKSETEKMVIGIRNFGGDWASTLEETTIDGMTVYKIAPDDQPQYFWVDDNWVFYIVPHNVTPDEIPQIIEAIRDQSEQNRNREP